MLHDYHGYHDYETVLDKGEVRLIDVMPYPMRRDTPAVLTPAEAAVVRAARTSTNAGLKTLDKDIRLLTYLIEHHHTSPFEMVEFKFEIKAPLLVWGHLDRYRTASQNRQSYRYVDVEADEFYTPHAWRVQSQSNKQASAGVLEDTPSNALYGALAQHFATSVRLYQDALKQGVAREQARIFLPAYALYQVGVWKMDLHNLINVFKQRNHPDAQYETREYARAMQRIVTSHAPNIMSIFESKGIINDATA
jgi:thymidylate synthase (FAD)